MHIDIKGFRLFCFIISNHFILSYMGVLRTKLQQINWHFVSIFYSCTLQKIWNYRLSIIMRDILIYLSLSLFVFEPNLIGTRTLKISVMWNYHILLITAANLTILLHVFNKSFPCEYYEQFSSHTVPTLLLFYLFIFTTNLDKLGVSFYLLIRCCCDSGYLWKIDWLH